MMIYMIMIYVLHDENVFSEDVLSDDDDDICT